MLTDIGVYSYCIVPGNVILSLFSTPDFEPRSGKDMGGSLGDLLGK
jgi:hypothetical protein